jgi:hypothetical protein
MKTELQTMHAAFELVSPEKFGAKDWRCAINAFVTISELRKAGVTIEDVAQAIAFMTATEASVSEPLGIAGKPGELGYVVRAKGYRAGPAGP